MLPSSHDCAPQTRQPLPAISLREMHESEWMVVSVAQATIHRRFDQGQSHHEAPVVCRRVCPV
jgi:hypothetical protein